MNSAALLQVWSSASCRRQPKSEPFQRWQQQSNKELQSNLGYGRLMWWNKWWLAKAYQYGFDFRIVSKNDHTSEYVQDCPRQLPNIYQHRVPSIRNWTPFLMPQPHRHRKRSSTPGCRGRRGSPHQRPLGHWAMVMDGHKWL